MRGGGVLRCSHEAFRNPVARRICFVYSFLRLSVSAGNGPPGGLAFRGWPRIPTTLTGTRSGRSANACAFTGPIKSMPKEEKVELEGEVVEALPNAMFRVKLDNMDRVVLGHVAGKMRRFRIRILPGDRVRVELSPYDLDRARIVYRHR